MQLVQISIEVSPVINGGAKDARRESIGEQHTAGCGRVPQHMLHCNSESRNAERHVGVRRTDTR